MRYAIIPSPVARRAVTASPVVRCAITASPVIPANAGIHSSGIHALDRYALLFSQWIPAFAGMTAVVVTADVTAVAAVVTAVVTMLVTPP